MTYEEDLYDDADFYQELLRDLIETSARESGLPGCGMSFSLLTIADYAAESAYRSEISKLRKKKKTSETRISKDRKIRFRNFLFLNSKNL